VKKHRILSIIVLVLITTSLQRVLAQETPTAEPTPRPKPPPVTVIQEGDHSLEIFFDTLPQGRAGLLHVLGPNMISARTMFLDERVQFFPVEGDGLYGFIAVNMEQTPRVYDLPVFILLNDGSTVEIMTQITVSPGGFIRQEVTVAPDRVDLLDPEIERGELARLESIFSVTTPQPLWDEDGFRAPLDSVFTSPFGVFRIFNNTIPSRHTGWDMRAPVGTPVMASAAGRVAFAGTLDIRGNHVIIDHGKGIYSTYSHFSQIHVTRGQMVTAGQVIGMSGETGRAGGPHLHWEMAVNGEWIDSRDFIEMWLPPPA